MFVIQVNRTPPTAVGFDLVANSAISPLIRRTKGSWRRTRRKPRDHRRVAPAWEHRHKRLFRASGVWKHSLVRPLHVDHSISPVNITELRRSAFESKESRFLTIRLPAASVNKIDVSKPAMNGAESNNHVIPRPKRRLLGTSMLLAFLAFHVDVSSKFVHHTEASDTIRKVAERRALAAAIRVLALSATQIDI